MTNKDTTAAREEWWRDWFNTIYLNVYPHRDDAEAALEIHTTLSVIPLQPQHAILDLCCGNGRHIRSLRQRGFSRAIGLDYSFPLLKHALAEKPRASYVRGDMRILPFHDGRFDAVLSYFTSFGYFKTNIENLEVLYEMARVLKSGGWFLLDYLNPDHVRATFSPESTRQHGDYSIHERRFFSEDGERIEKEITIQNWGGEDRRYYESVRLYTREELQEMLHVSDLFVLGELGSFDGRGYSADMPRMILYGVRK